MADFPTNIQSNLTEESKIQIAEELLDVLSCLAEARGDLLSILRETTAKATAHQAAARKCGLLKTLFVLHSATEKILRASSDLNNTLQKIIGDTNDTNKYK